MVKLSFRSRYTPQRIALLLVMLLVGLSAVLYGNVQAAVLMGTPPINVQIAPSYNTGGNVADVPSLSDLNGDGKLDIAVANNSSSNIGILLGNGNGTFQTAVTYATDSDPSGATPADLDNDGDIDLVVTRFGYQGFAINYNAMGVLLNNGNGTFQPYSALNIGNNPYIPIITDLNGDGKVDLIVPSNANARVLVSFGNGNGTFQTPVNYIIPSQNPVKLVLSDYNMDGKPDLAVGAANPNRIYIMLGNGDGTFQPVSQTYTVASAPTNLSGDDLNGDGRGDLIVGNGPPNEVFVLLSNGDGTFTQVSPSTPSPNNFDFVQVGDFNGDNIPDVAKVAYPGTGTVKFFAGNGDGTFVFAFECAIGYSSARSTVGDVDKDGKSDLVVTGWTNVVTVILSSGSPKISISDVTVNEGNVGTTNAVFTVTLSAACCSNVSINYATGDNTATLADNDYNATSGTLTFAPGQTSKMVTVTVNGDTKFEPTETFTVTLSNPTGVTLQKSVGVGTIFNDDVQPTVSVNDSSVVEGTGTGTTTLVFTPTLTNASSLPVTVTYTTADGTATQPADYGLASGSVVIAPGTLSQVISVTVVRDNLTEQNETFLLNFSAQNATVTDNQVIGTIVDDDNPPIVKFLTQPSLPTGGSFADIVSLGDFNGDTKPDIVVANNRSSNIGLLRGNGDGTFQPAVAIPTDSEPSSVTPADLDNDGDLDMVVSRFGYSSAIGFNAMGVLLNNGNGTFQPYMPLDIGRNTYVPIITDLNGDGNRDLIVPSNADGRVIVSLGNGNGTFQTPSSYSLPSQNPAKLVADDYNGDGKLDLAVGAANPNRIYIMLGNGNGTFQTPSQNYSVLAEPVNLQSGDLNGDGRADLIVGNGPPNGVFVLLGNGNGTFTPVSPSTPSPNNFDFIQVADYNSDGILDFSKVDYPGNGTIKFYFGRGDGTFVFGFECPIGYSAARSTVGDVNGDGKPDLVVTGWTNVVTVLLNSVLPTVSVSDVTVTEGNAGTTSAVFTVTLSAGCCTDVTVNYATTDNSATTADNDYIAASGVLTFTPGQVSKTVTVTVNGDTKIEPTETFSITLSNPTNATLLKSVGVGTITDDDDTTCQNVLVVTSPTDNGLGTTCGTLSFALTQSAGMTVTFALTGGGNTITMTGALTSIVLTGATVDGGNGNGIAILGAGVSSDGLRLSGENKLKNLTISGFAGREIVSTGQNNRFDKVRVSNT
jgi:hypothetical protein